MPLVSAPASRGRMRSLLAVSSLATVAVLGLAGCAAEAAPEPSSSAGASTSSTPTAAPGETPTGTPKPTVEPGTPITISCDQLLTPDDIYAFNPNLGVDPGFAPDAASLAGVALADNGIACGYLHQSSGELMNFALSQPSPAALTAALNAAASSSNPVPTYGVPPEVTGFFTVADGAGQVQLFTPEYWLTATSTMFFEPGDVGGLIDAALSHLPE